MIDFWSMDKANEVVDAYLAAFPLCGDWNHRPSIEEVEAVMRPFAPISYEVQIQIDRLFEKMDLNSLSVGEHCWWEADFAVSGDGPMHQLIIWGLVSDPCTCVVPHLEAAIAKATRSNIDHRLVALRDLWIECDRDDGKFHDSTDIDYLI